jgi:predicted AlkP superfamily pyrophosphatase or phosphodiesterase
MRRAAWLAWVTAAALLLVAGLTADDQSPRPAPHVVLISIDGLRPDTYLRADGPRIPTLRRLVAAGAYASGVVGVFPTLTYPSHTSLITGVTPREHGIVHNRFLRPTDQPNASWYWFARDITAPTLAGAVHASGRRSAAVSWPVTVGADLDLLFPEYFRSDRSEAFRVLGEMSRPATLLHDVEKARGSPLPWPMTDGWRTEIAAWMFKKYQPHLLLLHLLDTDAAQHESGPDSERTRAAIEAADASVRHVLDAVEAAGLGDRTNVVIVSDHGFAPVTRQLQPNALFKREGWLQVDSNGQILSWRVFFQPSGGSGFVFLENPRDAALTTRVAELLAQLAGDPAHGIDRVIHGTELNVWAPTRAPASRSICAKGFTRPAVTMCSSESRSRRAVTDTIPHAGHFTARSSWLARMFRGSATSA